MSLTLLSDTLTFNGKVYKRAYEAATKTWAGTSAAGRQDTTLIDPQGRPLTRHTGGLEPVHYRYDSRGRLTEPPQAKAMRPARSRSVITRTARRIFLRRNRRETGITH